MKRRMNARKAIVLSAWCLALLLMLNGCFIQPDKTVSDPLADDVHALPFDNQVPLTTATPTAPPAGGPTATAQASGWEDWSGGTNNVVAPTKQPLTTNLPVPYQGTTSSPSGSTSAPAPVVSWQPVTPTSAPADDGVLRYGEVGEDVKDLQRELKTLGYYTGSVDGDFGKSTQAAVEEFQRVNGLSADGVAGARTVDRLYGTKAIAKPKTQTATSAPTFAPVPKETNYRYLEQGGSGNDVKKLQQRLKDLGYFAGSVNGNYGLDTLEAVKAFQKTNKLWDDGIAGPDTQSMLFSNYAASAGNTVSSGYRTLKEGSTGNDVVRLQQRLALLGYYSYTPDGNYGAGTVAAVQAFQQVNGLTVDGVAGSGTQTKLYSKEAIAATGAFNALPTFAPIGDAGTLREGNTGDAVYRLQERLYDLGYYTGRIDGSYGSAVTAAVYAFQQRNSLGADGVAGSATQVKIYSTGAVANVTSGSLVTPASTIGTLKEGMVSDDVMVMQQWLRKLNYLAGDADGRFGSTTTAAVKAFQVVHGIQADGVAGARTLEILFGGTATANLSDPVGNTGGGIATGGGNTGGLATLNNRDRELAEQSSSGTLQVSVSGGGIATAANGVVYFANGNTGGTIYARNSQGVEWQIIAETARFLHVFGDGKMFYVSTEGIIQNTLAGNRQVLSRPSYVLKMSVYNGMVYYQVGNVLMQVQAGMQPLLTANDVNDFTIDMVSGAIYVATNDGVFQVSTGGTRVKTETTSAAQQVFLCGNTIYFRQSGAIYRINNGAPALVISANATWAGVYRDRLYYISNSQLFTCDTVGQNARMFDAGPVATVSFISGEAYIGSSSGGGSNRRVSVP